ncbi:16S rRNA (cytosine(1402)-N(4))-methyltransferase RsmH [Devosia neptuniae]|jgi:16S rRNA (cytosine1402-N4)-methyltransferase|uniref:16S rRNA (cytosine(1402)-N(4))-methyltransferase RsmH n=1 Tax=Devosia TaxID=46913 RepID=UPI0022AE63D9|nr:16S rRNA (cytosine(1402)-N(4))-methyltransferase RsmH [Devosia neptuniae]MCZ4345770.1 16S rRNA (cytosine(1402)-N(4))-methyltransferase RsmH [Devosia neptuniae]|tara:strand:+ start:69986 stop:70984 length:999 start_codon:yes stop_codon:yes gene_type:complete
MGKRSMPDTSSQAGPHVPVLLDEVLAAFDPIAGKRIVDGTFGAGGYSRAMLEAGATVIAIDRDPSVQPYADALSAEFDGRFFFVPGTFSQLDSLAADHGPIDGVVLDIGVSSMQLDQAERGFSFMRDGPLDMRMSGSGESAADLVNALETEQLANLLYAFGEERKSRRIAQFIVAARETKPIETTLELARIIEKSIGRKPGDAHPATRSFQALRIAVNAEFDQLVEALFAAERLLDEGGRLVVVSFHSLEDRIVKRFFDPEKGGPSQSRHMPQVQTEARRWVEVAKARKAGEAELSGNPRARSAVLRAATRSDADSRPVKFDGLGVPKVREA